MRESIYVRLTHIMDDLARLVRHVQPLEIQLALEHVANRLDDMIDETIGLEAERPDEEAE